MRSLVDPAHAGALVRLPPRRGIKLQQNFFLFFHQRKKMLHVRTKFSWPTSRGPSAHELTGVIIVPKSDPVAQLMGNEIATDVGKPERRTLKAANSNETFVGLLEGHGEGNKAASDRAMIKSRSIWMKPDGGPTSARFPSSIARRNVSISRVGTVWSINLTGPSRKPLPSCASWLFQNSTASRTN